MILDYTIITMLVLELEHFQRLAFPMGSI